MRCSTRRRFAAVLVAAALCLTGLAAGVQAGTGRPRTFNLFLARSIEPDEIALLARYDALGLDVDIPDSILDEIRSHNPSIKLLAYVAINGTYSEAWKFPAGSRWRLIHEAAEANNWWLWDTDGDHVSDWPGKYDTNLTDDCPTNGSGQRFSDWFPPFLADSVLRNGAASWDGIFLDDVWASISFASTDTARIDANLDGLADDPAVLDARWSAGNDSLTARLKRLIPADKIVVGNGFNTCYHMNGMFFERFPAQGASDDPWFDSMFDSRGYFSCEDNYSDSPARLNVINVMWPDPGLLDPVRTPEYKQQNRFFLASTLLRDGYFAMDSIHDNIWWEADYEKPIGDPVGAPYQATYNGMTLWRRDYSNGAVILNSNKTMFMGSTTDGVPPMIARDARILLTSELWHPETVPPAAITDLAVTKTWSNRAEVEWTTVGDDGVEGQAVEVEVRYATSIITEGDWAAATVAPFAPRPGLAGLSQTLTVYDLQPGLTYYFAIKTRDLAGNWSPLSNVASAAMVLSDLIPPAAITDLTVLSTTQTAATLQWTAPGDDGSTGTATQFDLRLYTSPIDTANFATAYLAYNEPAPGPAGTVHTLDIYPLTPGTTYYFAIRTADEMPNWSPLSNVTSGVMMPGDTTPPAAVTDLRIAAVGSDWMTLEWSAPGDDGLSGQATRYDLRMARFPITVSSWVSCEYVIGEPIPGVAGTIQSVTVSGIGVGFTYYFALKTTDEFPNTSGLSNVVVGTTGGGDGAPPATVTDLAVTGSTMSTITLSWTAPGDDGAAGTATSYDLRYSTAPILIRNFAAAAAATGEPTPTAAGTTQTMTVSGLSAGTTYYFALKTSDEVPNTSYMSNVPSGATPATPPPADTTPPAAVANLAVTGSTTTTVSLSWTAPGDDGSTGTAAGYDLRYSTAAITAANFASAAAATGEPTPTAAGTTQTMTVSGLAAGTTYYFALKTSDEVPNTSAISNVPSGATSAAPPPADITAPAAVANLAVTGSTTTTISLSWTAPGDDGSTGTAAGYDLRYSTAVITAASFASAAAATGEPTPTAAGTTQTMTVSGLTAGTTYYFALKTSDEVPNTSAISNVPSGATSAPPPPTDTTPPAAVANLAVTGSTTTTVSLSWTAPGDDGSTGTAAGYDLRYSTAVITAANFGSAIAATGEPTPTAAGTTQTMTVSGLTAGTTYYFALKTSDEVPNTSGISNVPSGATSATPPPTDTTPPATVANLAVTDSTTTTISLSWTAPGDDGSTGTAAGYDLRYSTAVITAANFASAAAATGEPTPTATGTTQAMTVSGLTAGTTYYFALKTSDEVPNTSAISNVPSGATSAAPPPTDTTAPAAVANLAVTGSTTSTVSLSWTAPGDDGSTGTAANYDLRYSTAAITAANFASAAAATGEPTPTAAGTTQTMTVSGLTAGTTYHFALKTSDEVPNTSAISNVPSGATSATPPPADTTPPAAVANLAVTGSTTTTISLSWTAPGDDGSTGTAAGYDLRYSTAAITAANFASAAAATGEPTPTAAGTAQAMTVSGLSAGTTYYFALKTSDEVPNTSAISNVPSGATSAPPPPTDTTPPAAVANLAVTGSTTTTVSLSWTAPGDDGSTGTAAGYDLRYSTAAITAANFGSAAAATGEPTPTAAGTTQAMTVSGLTAGTTYYFALKTSDEVPNTSAISNVPSGATSAAPPPTDTTPPAAVANLAVTGSTTSTVSLSWAAPGDDGSTGTAAGYDLRYSTAAITAANFASAAAATGEPTPTAAGTTQAMTVSGLTAGTTYYFALKTSDEVPNTSAISNVPSGATSAAPPPADTTPPAAVANLAVTGSTTTTVSLSWTAPGDDGSTGTAAGYDLRYSTAAITAANFGSAIAATGEPTPTAAGTTQAMTVSGLSAGTTYYFALKTSDEVPNTSAISNVPSGVTSAAPPPTDTTAPAAVALALAGADSTSIVLTWNAPGDDGLAGTATAFDLRLASEGLTDATWSSGTVVSGLPAPGPAGTLHTVIVGGLAPSTTWFFALRSVDEAGNWSAIGPSLEARTTDPWTPPATQPPLAPTGLSATLIGTTVRLRWDAGTEAGVSGYNLYRRPAGGPWARLNANPLVYPAGQDTVDDRAVTLEYSVTALNRAGQESPRSLSVSIIVSNPKPGPGVAALSAPAPNPFRQQTEVTIDVPEDGGSGITMIVLDVRGRAVRLIHEGDLPAGQHEFVWDGRDQDGAATPAGVYFFILNARTHVECRKIVRTR